MANAGNYVSLAFVSGKGGVGKTTIAANVAWLLSTAPCRVLMIDLDFQNLGATGLFGSRYTLDGLDALSLLRNGLPEDMPLGVAVISKDMSFLPAAPLSQPGERQDAFIDVPKDVDKRLRDLLDRLSERFSFDCFVLDCHGGIDALSIAAAGVCDHTLIVTEADTVSFAGTICLFDSYYDKYLSANHQPTIDYIVNRIPSKYSYRDLNRVYDKYLNRHLGRLTKSESVLCYIPAEGYLADSFGDYPFQVQLAPPALFTRKLELLLYKLFAASHQSVLSKKIIKRFKNEKYSLKIHTRITSNEARNIRTVSTAFALFPLFFFLSGLVGVVLSFPPGWIPRVATFVIAAGGSLAMTFYYLLGTFRLTLYFRDKLRFQKALVKVVERRKAFWQRLSLWKLRTLYYGSIAGALMVILIVAWFALLFVYTYALFSNPLYSVSR